MKDKEFIDSFKTKTVRVLLELLRQGQTGELKIEPEKLQVIIDELNNRQLSVAEQSEFEDILNLSFDETKCASDNFSTDEIETITGSSDSRNVEPFRYSALKTVVGLISVLGYIVIIIGIIAFIYLASKDELMIGFCFLVSSIIIALPLLAYSNMIYVLIDTEFNTRKTMVLLARILEKK